MNNSAFQYFVLCLTGETWGGTRQMMHLAKTPRVEIGKLHNGFYVFFVGNQKL